MSEQTRGALEYFEDTYTSLGFGAQRRFPNEELCRFMGRNYFGLAFDVRANTRILETGCGAGANLWMIAREGFDAVGVDLSPAAVKLCAQMLDSYDCHAELHTGDMCALPVADGSCDAIVDVFSSHCLNQKQGAAYLTDVYRALKPGGRFFSYFPSTRSDTWTDARKDNSAFSIRVDDETLNGLHRPTDPYVGNTHPFRFLHPRRYRQLLEQQKFEVPYCETVSRTYRGEAEYFEFVAIEGVKGGSAV